MTWTPFVRKLWEETWDSPVGLLWKDGATRAAAFRLARLWQAFWDGDLTVAASIDRLEDRLGVTNKARRQLSVEIVEAGGREAGERAAGPLPVDDLRLRLVPGGGS